MLAVIVVWLFLRDWRATWISALALPLSIMPTFAVMHWFGFTLNTLTLLALALVVGILVDDAIVEVENIVRHLRDGQAAAQATMDAVDRDRPGGDRDHVDAGGGVPADAFMTRHPGLVLQAVRLDGGRGGAASLLVARLLTPMLAAWFLQPDACREDARRPADAALPAPRCAGASRIAADRRSGRAAFFVGSLALVPLLPTGFMPAGRSRPTRGRARAAARRDARGRRCARPRRRAQRCSSAGAVPGIAQRLHDRRRAARRAADAAAASAPAKCARRAHLHCARATRRPHQQRDRGAIRERLPRPAGRALLGRRRRPGREARAGGLGPRLRGAATAAAATVEPRPARRCRSSAASPRRRASSGRRSSSARTPARAAELGVIDRGIARDRCASRPAAISTSALAKLNLADRQIDIRVRCPRRCARTCRRSPRCACPAATASVPLDSGRRRRRSSSGPAQIDRFDREPQRHDQRRPGRHAARRRRWPRCEGCPRCKLPPGVQLRPAGDAEVMVELFGGFALAMLTGMLCVYCVLVLLFNDFVPADDDPGGRAAVVGGAFIALLLCGSELDAGADRPGDAARHRRPRTRSCSSTTRSSAMREQGMTRARGADRRLPQARAADHDDDDRDGRRHAAARARPRRRCELPRADGVAVIGGLVTSTALSLLVVPVVFLYVARLESRVRRLLGMRPACCSAPMTRTEATDSTETRFPGPIESPSSAG